MINAVHVPMSHVSDQGAAFSRTRFASVCQARKPSMRMRLKTLGLGIFAAVLLFAQVILITTLAVPFDGNSSLEHALAKVHYMRDSSPRRRRGLESRFPLKAKTPALMVGVFVYMREFLVFLYPD